MNFDKKTIPLLTALAAAPLVAPNAQAGEMLDSYSYTAPDNPNELIVLGVTTQDQMKKLLKEIAQEKPNIESIQFDEGEVVLSKNDMKGLQCPRNIDIKDPTGGIIITCSPPEEAVQAIAAEAEETGTLEEQNSLEQAKERLAAAKEELEKAEEQFETQSSEDAYNRRGQATWELLEAQEAVQAAKTEAQAVEVQEKAATKEAATKEAEETTNGVPIREQVQALIDRVPGWAVLPGSMATILAGLGIMAWRRRRQLGSSSTESGKKRASGEETLEVNISSAIRDLDPAGEEVTEAEGGGETAEAKEKILEEADDDIKFGRYEEAKGILSEALESYPDDPDILSKLAMLEVLAEADIYILYGRYREAESLLREALEQNPQNPTPFRYKLAEAYVGCGKGNDLETLLNEMRENGDATHDPEKWRQLENALPSITVPEAKVEASADPADPDPDSDSDSKPETTSENTTLAKLNGVFSSEEYRVQEADGNFTIEHYGYMFRVFVSENTLTVLSIDGDILSLPNITSSDFTDIQVKGNVNLKVPSNVTIDANITSQEGSIHNHGKINGNVMSQEGSIHNHGKINGNVMSQEESIYNEGTITGNVMSQEESIDNEGTIVGNAEAKFIVLYNPQCCTGTVTPRQSLELTKKYDETAQQTWQRYRENVTIQGTFDIDNASEQKQIIGDEKYYRYQAVTLSKDEIEILETKPGMEAILHERYEDENQALEAVRGCWGEATAVEINDYDPKGQKKILMISAENGFEAGRDIPGIMDVKMPNGVKDVFVSYFGRYTDIDNLTLYAAKGETITGEINGYGIIPGGTFFLTLSFPDTCECFDANRNCIATLTRDEIDDDYGHLDLSGLGSLLGDDAPAPSTNDLDALSGSDDDDDFDLLR